MPSLSPEPKADQGMSPWSEATATSAAEVVSLSEARKRDMATALLALEEGASEMSSSSETEDEVRRKILVDLISKDGVTLNVKIVGGS